MDKEASGSTDSGVEDTRTGGFWALLRQTPDDFVLFLAMAVTAGAWPICRHHIG